MGGGGEGGRPAQKHSQLAGLPGAGLPLCLLRHPVQPHQKGQGAYLPALGDRTRQPPGSSRSILRAQEVLVFHMLPAPLGCSLDTHHLTSHLQG